MALPRAMCTTGPEVDCHLRSAEMPKGDGRRSSRSLCVPASVVTLCQSLEQATLVAGHVGRAAAVFRYDEVVVVDEDTHQSAEMVSWSAALMAKLLQYQETPQYLRKRLIPIDEDLRCVGSMPPLDAPHHQRSTEWSRFREGVALETDDAGSVVDIGLEKSAVVKDRVRPGLRVTLNVSHRPRLISRPDGEFYSAKVCHPMAPVKDYGIYWGFRVRVARGLSAVFLECPFENGYDLVVGTSEHGQHIPPSELELPRFLHLLVVFGGPAGLEDCCAKDTLLKDYKPKDFCRFYLNTCPQQGSRTIRTEEAMWISLSFLNAAVESARL